jgi:uncharacterized protein (DUF488 family)
MSGWRPGWIHRSSFTVHRFDMRIYTIGHSTRTLAELVGLLRDNGVRRLADIRRFPGSRRHPHFASEALARSLPDEGIAYVHMPELGGRRAPRKDSPNTAWRVDQFRGYADHMDSDEFRGAVDRLLAFEETTAIMCAEAVPWRCHRQLVADDLLRRGVDVVHILAPGSRRRHEMNENARIIRDERGERIIYPAAQEGLAFGPEL